MDSKTTDLVRYGDIDLLHRPEWLEMDTDDVVQYDVEKHREDLKHLAIKTYGITEEQAGGILDRLKGDRGQILLNPWDIKYFWVSNNVLYEGGEMVGHAVVGHNLTYPPDTAVLMGLIANNEETRRKLISKGLKEMKEMGDVKLRINAGRWGFPNEEIFKDYVDGFQLGLAYWERDL